MKLSKIGLLVVMAVVICSVAFAGQGPKSPAGAFVASNAPDQPAAVKHVLKSTYINTCIPSNTCFSFTLASGAYTAVDAPTTVVCPGTSGTCLIQADQWLEVGGTTTAGNNTALCLLVDGVIVSAGGFACYYNEETPTDGSFIMGSFSQGTNVSAGSHTVQTTIWTDFGATGAAYTNTYRVYKP